MFNIDLDFMIYRNASLYIIHHRMNNRCIIDKHFHFYIIFTKTFPSNSIIVKNTILAECVLTKHGKNLNCKCNQLRTAEIL